MPPLLSLILAESELELVPEEIKGHPSVTAPAKRAGGRATRSVLDSSLHHSALRSLPQGERRGRPDIVHLFLLTALDSILNQTGGLQVFVHTRHDALVTVAPETRIMRNYNRFSGLMEQLLRHSRTPLDGKPLLSLEPGVGLGEAVKRLGADHTILFDAAGKPARLAELFPAHAAAGRHLACVIGGFPKGEFRSDLGFASERLSLHPSPLSAWVVAAEAIVNWENATPALPLGDQ